MSTERLIKWKIDPDQLNMVLVILSVMIFLSSFMLPLVFILILQDVFYFSRDHWIFVAPRSAYYTFGAGMLWTVLIMVAYMIVSHLRDRAKKETKHGWAFVLAGLLFIPICTLGVTNYYFIDDEGFHINELTSYQADHYPWGSIEEVQTYGEENGDYYTHFVFRTENNDTFTLTYDHNLASMRRNIFRTLEAHGAEILEHQLIESEDT
ncbi:hypothetical protein JSY36_17105 [Bacillus sp. H-16]|uniref:hypothetical protein n=1 Tax=Alteribacter salitolerans TaxID=2912333 RepID=UPI001963CDBC|nr:hypothetical protein [Alteribacter salitolerans]MBM7097455.1 hypothetical protein [Alteribacter salitolerans]